MMANGTIPDIYWGEFPEAELDGLLAHMRAGNFEEARKRIEELGRTDFIFGLQRSDFLYYMKLGPQARILDVGCGLGVHAFNAARLAGRVDAFDQSKKRVEFCQLRAQAQGVGTAHFFHSDLARLDFPPASFDGILLNGVVEWLGEVQRHPNPREDQREALSNLRQLLKPGGRLYIGIENRFALAYFRNGRDHSGLKYTSLMPRFMANAYLRLRKKKPYRTYTYSRRGYERLLTDAGFQKDKIKFYIAHPGYNLPQYLIDFDDVAALRFFLQSLTAGKGFRGRIVRLLAHSDFCLRAIRNLFFSFAIYVEP